MDEYSGLTVTHIGAHAPVSPAEERRLLKLVVNGRNAESRLRKTPAIAEREELMRALQAGQKARLRLIETNGRLVVSIAAKYHRYQPHIPMSELCQEGVLGLMRALDKFDLSRETRLSTYASWWIRQSVGRYLNQQRTIRLPVHQVDRVSRLHRATFEILAESGMEPGIDDLATRSGEKPENIKLLQPFIFEPVSLDAPVGEDNYTWMDFLAGDALQPEKSSDELTRQEQVDALIERTLDAREAKIIRLRFGLGDGESMTLERISVRYGLTRERIRQIEHQALSKLRQKATPEMRLLIAA